jgi:hypothetical protein
MIRYKVTTPTAFRHDKEGQPLEAFNKKTLGVRFEQNQAVFDDITIKRADLGYTAEEIASLMVKDFGYTVVVIDEQGNERPFTPKAVKTTLVENILPAIPTNVAEPRTRKKAAA